MSRLISSASLSFTAPALNAFHNAADSSGSRSRGAASAACRISSNTSHPPGQSDPPEGEVTGSQASRSRAQKQSFHVDRGAELWEDRFATTLILRSSASDL